MPALLAGFAPIWLLTAVGYVIARTGLLGEQAEAVLGRFVFHVAMPAALFTMLARTPLGSFADSALLAFAAGTLVASLLGFAAARRLFGRGLPDQAIAAMAAGYVNSANLGIPVATQVLGDATFLVPVLLFQVLLVSPLILSALDAGTGRVPGSPRRFLTLPLRNPIILASALGALCSAGGIRLPSVLTHCADLLGAAAVPTALVALGMSLHGRPVERRSAELGLAVAVKTLVQPLTAYLVGGPLLHLPAHQLLAVVVCSALPTAQNVFVYAREYGLATALARDSVLCSTLVSMGTLSAVAWLLAARH